MTGIDPETVIQRRPNVTVEIDSFGGVSIRGARRPMCVPRSGLRVLDYFSRPRTISQAIRECEQATGSGLEAEGWIQSIFGLLEAGALVTSTEYQTLLVPSALGFDGVPIHARMIEDEVRTKAFLAALRMIVRPEDVVVDIGTGTGILAVAAGLAGARRVYGIEAGQFAAVARKVAERNDKRGVVEIVQGYSYGIDLPERGNVLVSEILGNDPFAEDILPTFDDARRRLLVPGATLIPFRFRLFGFLTLAPASFTRRSTFGAARLKTLSARYGVDLTPLAEAVSGVAHSMAVPPAKVRRWPSSTPPQLLFEVDLRVPGLPQLSLDAGFDVGDRPFNALCLYFEADLAEGVSISTSPFVAGDTCSWNVMTWMLRDWPVRRGVARFHVAVENQRRVRVSGPARDMNA